MYIKCSKEVEEEQHSGIFVIDSTGCAYPHVVIVTYCAIRTDSTKTHIIVVANDPIRTDSTQSYRL